MPTMTASRSFALVALTLLYAVATASSSSSFPHHHRRLLLPLHGTNLAARVPPTPTPAHAHAARVPSTGAFPASTTQGRDDDDGGNHPASSSTPPHTLPTTTNNKSHRSRSATASRPVSRWVYTIVLPAVAGALLLVLAAGAAWYFLMSPCRETATIGPWKTGLSGQLQKAFVTGVPKLQRSELDRACEELSNIVASHRHYTVYKGTLSSGVEIAVVSTTATAAKDWSDHAESCFRRKIESMSRINHKNFVNLLGFCAEEEPFTRMMVLEYAPNGSLYENLHNAEEFEHVDWRGRMRIVMGLAYCIQHMHELSPPVVHPDLHSGSVLLSEDGAAKIVDMSVWQDAISEGKRRPTTTTPVVDRHEEQVSAALASNVYDFGVLLLEIISGKLPPHSEHDDDGDGRSMDSSVLESIKNDVSMASLLDPTLTTPGPKEEAELTAIGEVIKGCVQSDPRDRPSMREVTARLRHAVGISPVAATPRLSPLWWAELEVVSAVEAG